MNKYQEFGRINAGYKPASAKSKVLGNLLLDNLAVEYQKSFAILQHLKKTKYAHIYPKTRLRIVANKK